jgi:cytochrome oxidase Cu insertion factor (SCO1/SenC/PrrC family)
MLTRSETISRSLGRAGGWRVVVLLAAAVAALAPLAGVAAEDIRPLLEALRIDIPVQPLNAPAFSLLDLKGTPVRLTDFQGRIVMLYFWTTW